MSNYKWTTNLSIATPMILIGSIIISGGGHGFTNQLIVLFPWASIFLSIDFEFLFYFFALIQFPIYGILYDKAFNKVKTLFVIGIIHFLIMLAVLFLKNK
ncbi:hypothetical protein [Flavobacterium reichenbachii]|uniref:Uncharacterized protein n=1 Tax=Flavobacterium reichenbachii TaxID=362418 RepID=A0A085ZK70_9FLAO|nr:hypothetical protein [Flavobacterium reichenbachii]KFF04834.1 hypothetical protein IW19_04490 [Flavobacterium reichenbachii]OXB12179.1 hypothetical protein B0A68_19665 [Flavobacterium reichenbachii]